MKSSVKVAVIAAIAGVVGAIVTGSFTCVANRNKSGTAAPPPITIQNSNVQNNAPPAPSPLPVLPQPKAEPAAPPRSGATAPDIKIDQHGHYNTQHNNFD